MKNQINHALFIVIEKKMGQFFYFYEIITFVPFLNTKHYTQPKGRIGIYFMKSFILIMLLINNDVRAYMLDDKFSGMFVIIQIYQAYLYLVTHKLP